MKYTKHLSLNKNILGWSKSLNKNMNIEIKTLTNESLCFLLFVIQAKEESYNNLYDFLSFSMQISIFYLFDSVFVLALLMGERTPNF